MIDFMPLQKLPEVEGNLGKIILATGFEKMPKPLTTTTFEQDAVC